MNVRTTIVVSVLAVAGVVAALFVESRSGDGTSVDAAGTRPLLTDAPAPETVERITLRRGEDAAMVFARGGYGWEQVEPFAYPMDAYSIEQLVRGALAAEGSLVDGQASSASALGLDPPQATLTLEGPDGSVDLHFGRRGFAGRAYARVGGDERFWAVDYAVHDRVVAMDAREWRDRRLFHDVGVDSDRIEVMSGEAAIVLNRDRRTWMMVEPVRTRVNLPACEELFQALGRAPAAGFVLDEPAKLDRFGLADPAGSITVHSTRVETAADGTVTRRPHIQRLLVGARMGVGRQDRFGLVEGRPTVVRLSEPVVAAFFFGPETLVATTGSGVQPADVKAVVIRGEHDELRLERDLARWVAPDYDGRAVPTETVDGLLKSLTGLPANAIEIRPYPRELEIAAITLIGFDAKPIDTVRVARAAPGDDRFALENGDNVLRIYSSSFALPLTPAAFGIEVSAGPMPERLGAGLTP